MDTDKLKAEQGRNWGSVAAGWNKWWETIERAARRVSDRLVELADIQPGHKVLDVATGVGEPAITAARRVGRTGRVVAIDLAPEMVALARKRAAALGLGNIEFQKMDAETLAFPEGTFDAVLCRWGLMFLPDLAGALGRMRRLLRDDGRFATAAWGPPSEVPMISLSNTVLAERLMIDEPDSPLGPFRFSQPGILGDALRGAGFGDVTCERFPITFEFQSPEVYTRFRQDATTMAVKVAQQYPAERVADAWREVTEAARRYADPEGRVHMRNEVVCAMGRR